MAKVGEITTPTDVTLPSSGGTVILNGARAPLGTDGATGNYWHDTVGKTLYGPKLAVAVALNEIALNPAAVPQFPNINAAYRMGIIVRFVAVGTVSALRFYRPSSSTATSRNLYLYRAGVQVATVASSGESGSGWKTVPLVTPVAVDTGVDYVSAYETMSWFAETDSPGVTANPASPNITIVNGCYGSPGAFPPNVVGINYHADLVYSRTGAESFWSVALKSAS